MFETKFGQVSGIIAVFPWALGLFGCLVALRFRHHGAPEYRFYFHH